MAVVHLIDASPYIFRAYFSLPETLTDRDGRPANAVRGFATFLLGYIRDERPTHLGVAFDESLTTSFRNDFYPQYKASRDLPPPELEAQLRACRDVADVVGAATFSSERYEADDLIASLVHALDPAGHEVVIASPDKDLAQLVSERVTLVEPARGRRLDRAGVREALGVEPEQVADLLALAGDPVDDIPGVAGIGRKTAAALLAAHGDLNGIYDHLDDIAQSALRGARRIREKLEAGRDLAFVSRRLALTARDAPIDADLEHLELAGADRAGAERIADALGWPGFRSRIHHWR